MKKPPEPSQVKVEIVGDDQFNVVGVKQITIDTIRMESGIIKGTVYDAKNRNVKCFRTVFHKPFTKAPAVQYALTKSRGSVNCVWELYVVETTKTEFSAAYFCAKGGPDGAPGSCGNEVAEACDVELSYLAIGV